MNTRSKVKRLQEENRLADINEDDINDNKEYEFMLSKYEKTLENMQNEITKKDKVIMEMTEEQESNTKEFVSSALRTKT